ncbi:transglutaminase domain-containing protein [Phycicoccus sp. BSK3Z-2]|uniref:Transglutaminase domain-containing protein n=1 Tax=Phycicoccus avicenniae TaxID=2828860 RepID=A0A941DA44_9MICO|nr:transglutaminase-like domain-containing protein [Phycicoccus avicenniae]MBR7743252.1 transglutaminase domain-containing protein [Phycicoccus avicenniae]
MTAGAGVRAGRDAAGRGRADLLVDVLAVVVLTATALSAWTGTFAGPWWLVAAGAGVVAGVLLALATDLLRLPWWAAVPGLVAVLALLGPPLSLRGTAAGPWPTPASWAASADTVTDGWRRLLTTLPPVDGGGPLALLPLLLALVGSCVALLLARRTRAAWLPLLVPTVVGVAVAALGVVSPGGVLVRGLVLLAVGLLWGTARARRSVVTRTGAPVERFATAALLLAVVGVLVGGGASLLAPGDREVVREHVDPPVTTTDRPSPLAAFRAFRPVADDLADQELVRVEGLPAGTLLRLATVDTYSGTVWAAGDGTTDATDGSAGFLRIGARIPREDVGREVTARVTVGPGWVERRELRLWLPTLGDETSVEVEGPRGADLAERLRYNLDTGAAVLPGGLDVGESYTLRARLGAGAVPAGGVGATPTTPRVDPELTRPMARLVAAADVEGRPPQEQVREVGAWLRENGAYSDGGPGQETILPGHSLGRLETFVSETEPAGNDEQYAATLALTAAHLGLPARVVLGAVPGPDGVVRGADVRAYVEVWDDGAWTLLPPEDFVPDRDKAPSPRAVRQQDRSRTAVVPPPIAQRPPSSEDGFSLDESSSGQGRTATTEIGPGPPVWLLVTAGVVAVPVLGVPAWTLLLLGAKGLRRTVRRRRGSPRSRAAAAWQDVVDTLRDAGYPVRARDTRREVARAVGGRSVADAARAADIATYGPGSPSPQALDFTWSLTRRVRADVADGRSLRERWRRAVSLASFLPERSAEPIRVPSGIHAGRLVERRSAS